MVFDKVIFFQRNGVRRELAFGKVDDSRAFLDGLTQNPRIDKFEDFFFCLEDVGS